MHKKLIDKNRLALFIALMVITFVAFAPSLGHEFTNWDDNTHVTENEDVQSLAWSNIIDIFKSVNNKTYQPLTILSFALEYHFFAYNPAVYHLTNLLLHLCITALILIFAQQLGLSIRAAFLAALLFGIHPMRAESVAWVTERKDVLYGALYMLSVIQYWRYLNNHKRINYISSIVLGVLSMLAKPMALSLPLILMLCDWYKNKKLHISQLWDKIPYFALIAPIAWITFRLNTNVMILDSDISTIVIFYLYTFSFYFQKFFFPLQLLPLYELPYPVSITNPVYLRGVILFFLILFVVIRFRKNRLVLFAILFYYLSIFFLLRTNIQLYASWVADRFMYLPSVGLCLLLGYIADDFLKRSQTKGGIIRIGRPVILVIMILLLGGKTFQQTKIWENDLKLWGYVLSINPEMPRALNNRGLVYKGQKKYDLALADFSKAIKIAPRYYKPYKNRGETYGMLNKNKKAIWDFDRVIQINPDIEAVYNNRGYVYVILGKYNKAIRDFDKALELEPEFVKAYYNRANAYANLNKYDLALKDYDTFLKLDPEDFRAYSNRGYIYINQNRYREAIKDLNRSITLKPDYGNAYYNRSISYNALGNQKEALADALKAQELGAKIESSYVEHLQELVSSE